MIPDNKQVEKDINQKNIKFILELFNSNKLIEAKKEINKQIEIYPDSSILYNILGAVLSAQDQFDESIKNYNKSIKINPDYAQAYNNLGIVFQKLNKDEEAIQNYKKAIDLKSNFSEATNNLGNAILKLKKPKEALEYFKKALQINSNYAEAYYNMGIAYELLGDTKTAIENLQKAITVKPNYAEAYNSMGLIFSNEMEFDKSMVSYKKAIEIKPDYEKPYNNLGNLFEDLGKYDEATEKYHQAIKIKPDYALAYSNLLFNLNYKTNFDPHLYLSEAKNFRINCKTIKKKLSWQYQYEQKPKKLKLGFVSADFGNHPGGYFTLSTLRELRNKNFDLVAYSCWDRTDEFVHHFRPLFSKWSSIEYKSDEEIVEEIFKDGIHILIDLQGHSAKNRLPIFIYKPAPIQATWLGQGSTGIPEIDYFIGSPHITPKNEEKYYVEKVLRLSEISQTFTPPDYDIKINNLPATKNNFLTFGSTNKLTKINDDVISLWSKVLLSIPDSKLLLRSRELSSKKIADNTLARFKKFNVDKSRLILEGKADTRKEFLETYKQIDITLDTFPFQGNTSTCESVWMGVPVLTLKGDRYLFHFGESINSNLKMFDWIAKDQKDYIAKAIMLSSNFNMLENIRKNLRQKMLESPVGDAQAFSENFSNMLWKMWQTFSNKKNVNI